MNNERIINESRILCAEQLIDQIIESNKNGERFCFILGSGASVESGIPSGNMLEMQWMDDIMGESEDNKEQLDIVLRQQCAEKLYKDGLIEHSFDEIKKAWQEAKINNKTISSIYYFDIYKLRFYPNTRNGYRYLERIMESREPSIGYHTLALILTENKYCNNLVITTNFDSLIEDALFLYTYKKPLVVNHESLASYIESDIQRPIIAKVHRGLMYAPFNSPETTNKLKHEWRDALNYVFNMYTPIVIGYGGGDHSLMSYLEDESTLLRHGIYWCYREASGLPEDNIQRFIEKKDGYFVSVDGFDALMIKIGNKLYKDEITPSGTDKNLKNQYDRIIQQYKRQWNKLCENPETKQIIQSMNKIEDIKEKKRAEKKSLTAWDYIRRGEIAYNEKRYKDAIEEYTKAIKLRGDYASYYNNRGVAYIEIKKYDDAINDFNKALSIDVYSAETYNNLGYVYGMLQQYEKSMKNLNKAIELDCNLFDAFNNRGWICGETKQYEKAIDDFCRAINICSNDSGVYCNRGWIYNKLEQYEKALKDCKKSIELNYNVAAAHRQCGCAYYGLEKYEEAIAEYTVAIKLKEKYKYAYLERAKAYRKLGKNALADLDEENAKNM